MAASDLAKKLRKATSAQDHSKELAKVLTDYLTTNIQVPITYVGVIPGTPPVPDPIVADVLKVKGEISSLSNSTFDEFVASIEEGVMGFKVEDPGLAGVKPVAPLSLFKKGLTIILTQKDIKSIHTDTSKPTYKWEKVEESELEEKPSDIKELNSLSNAPVDKYFSKYIKIKNKDKYGNTYYDYYESIYAACDSIWLFISEKIIEWVENPVIHLTSTSGQGTKSGSNGTITTLPMKVL